MKVLTFSRSSSFMVLSFSHNSRYGVSASSIGAKNSAGVILKYEIILNNSLRDGKADPLVIPRMYEPLLSKEYVEFLVGRDGEVDQLVSSTVRRCKRTVRDDNSALVLVLPYAT